MADGRWILGKEGQRSVPASIFWTRENDIVEYGKPSVEEETNYLYDLYSRRAEAARQEQNELAARKQQELDESMLSGIQSRQDASAEEQLMQGQRAWEERQAAQYEPPVEKENWISREDIWRKAMEFDSAAQAAKEPEIKEAYRRQANALLRQYDMGERRQMATRQQEVGQWNKLQGQQAQARRAQMAQQEARQPMPQRQVQLADPRRQAIVLPDVEMGLRRGPKLRDIPKLQAARRQMVQDYGQEDRIRSKDYRDALLRERADRKDEQQRFSQVMRLQEFEFKKAQKAVENKRAAEKLMLDIEDKIKSAKNAEERLNLTRQHNEVAAKLNEANLELSKLRVGMAQERQTQEKLEDEKIRVGRKYASTINEELDRLGVPVKQRKDYLDSFSETFTEQPGMSRRDAADWFVQNIVGEDVLAEKLKNIQSKPTQGKEITDEDKKEMARLMKIISMRKATPTSSSFAIPLQANDREFKR